MPERRMDDPGFWDGIANFVSTASRFTVPFAERALAEAKLAPGAYVLDVATGNGALAITAARVGLRVLATDFSDAMVRQVLGHRLPGLDARKMDGQSLDLPDAAFDAAFSNFGVMLFADWRAGLAEMARVVRPGGMGSLGTWKHAAGAAGSLLLAETCAALFPDFAPAAGSGGMAELRHPDRLAAAMAAAGFADNRIVEETNDFLIDRAMLDDPDGLFCFSSYWPTLAAERKGAVLSFLRTRQETGGGVLAVPSTALIATGRRLG